VPRVGLDRIREVVLDEQSGAALRERFRLARAAVRDPWLEREDPYHPRQFTDLDDEPALVGPPIGGAR
jgi:nitrite reductase (NADH) large subunit